MASRKDLTGQKFGRLTVLYLDTHNPVKWKCLCDCGNEKSINSSCLRKGETKSCGCYNKELARRKFVDLTNKRVGRLTVIRKGPRDKRGVLMWECICDCGKIVIVNAQRLRKGVTKSCGCLVAETMSKNMSSNLIGKKFGRLTVLSKHSSMTDAGHVKWLCQCECGNTTIVSTAYLNCGSTKSCGCYASDFVRVLTQQDWWLDKMRMTNQVRFMNEQKIEA